MIKVVILDFDDTLCLTEEACFDLENEIAVSMNFSPMSRDTHQKNWGKILREAIIERVPGINVDEFMEEHERLIVDYVLQGKLDKISDENIKVLDEIKKAGKKLAILTSRDLHEVKHLLNESHPLSSRVEAFYHRDNSEYIKPDPRVFNNILYRFDIMPDECVYIGDAVTDAVAANGAGMHFIAVLESGLRAREDFKDVNVDLFIDKFADMKSYVLNN